MKTTEGSQTNNQLVSALLSFLTDEQVSINETILDLHSKDESYHKGSHPDIVVYPKNASEVSQIIQKAGEFQTPIIPFGVGSSLEGHVIPYKKGITMNFTEMNRILEVKEEDFLVKVQPGVTRSQLNKELKNTVCFSLLTQVLMLH